jgi:hypothetical protein
MTKLICIVAMLMTCGLLGYSTTAVFGPWILLLTLPLGYATGFAFGALFLQLDKSQ